jgi:Resolvase, N terminal domain
MRVLRIAPARQLALFAGQAGPAAGQWLGLPEQARAEVLALLARIIARGVMAGRRAPGRRAAVTDLADGPVLAISGEKITASHRARHAYVYVRQSTLLQVRANTESLARQYDLRQRAVLLGWPAHQVVVVDEDLGRSGASAAGRSGFSELVADVGLGKAGIVLALECSRLARSNADWYQLLDLCALTDTLIADADGIYHPGSYNDRLVLGLKGTMSEAEPAHHCPAMTKSVPSSPEYASVVTPLCSVRANSSVTYGTGPRTSRKVIRAGRSNITVSRVTAVSRPRCTWV